MDRYEASDDLKQMVECIWVEAFMEIWNSVTSGSVNLHEFCLCEDFHDGLTDGVAMGLQGDGGRVMDTDGMEEVLLNNSAVIEAICGVYDAILSNVADREFPGASTAAIRLVGLSHPLYLSGYWSHEDDEVK